MIPIHMNKNVIALILILCIAAWLRFANFSSNPPGFFCDEASIGYNAYSILHTGRDEFGTPFPLFFRAFGEYKNPIDIYLTIPFVAVFGLSEFSVRLSSVVMSLITILLIYILGKRMGSSSLGLIMASVYAITPWSIHLSRTNMEGLQHFVTLVTAALIALSLNRAHTYRIPLYIIFSAFASYSYFPARILMPLFVAGVIIWELRENNWKRVLPGICLYCMLLIPLGIHLLGGGMNRWNQVSFLQSTKYPMVKFLYSYGLHYSPDFLFLKGDIDMTSQFITRHSVRGIGELYIWQAPLILLGIYWMIKTKHRMTMPILLLLLIYPIPSSLTADISPQATRSIIGQIPLTVFTAFGTWCIFNFAQNIRFGKIFLTCLFILLCTSSVWKYRTVSNAYPLYAADFWGWQYGPRDMISYYKTHEALFDEFYMEGSFNAPEIFLSFYIPNPSERINMHIGSLERFDETKRQLFGVSADQYTKIEQKGLWIIHSILRYPNTKPAFYLISRHY